MSGPFAEAVSIEIARADGRALVALADDKPVGPLDHFSGLRASFLAHLIATRDRLPQTTVLRRATAEDAVLAYATHDAEHIAASRARTKSQLA